MDLGVSNSMNEVKPLVPVTPRENSESVSHQETLDTPRNLGDLPISNWDDYKSWCEKVKENWDVN